MFSQLEGLRFEWKVEGVVERLPLARGGVMVSEQRLKMEKEGGGSDWVLVRGLEIGKVRITVRLNEPGYEVAQLIVERADRGAA